MSGWDPVNASSGSDADDFTSLEGVGPKTAAALVAGGVTTMEQLAASRVDDLVALLDAGGVSTSADRIVARRWLGQAWEAAGRPSGRSARSQGAPVEAVDADQAVPVRSEPVAHPEPEPQTEPALRTGPGPQPAPAAPPSAPNGWQEHAGFIVTFDRRLEGDDERWQTRIWDITAMVEQTVAGTAPGPWIDFVIQRADLPRLR